MFANVEGLLGVCKPGILCLQNAMDENLTEAELA